jgi:mRNA interferase HigB
LTTLSLDAKLTTRMRIIKKSALRAFVQRHPNAQAAIEAWIQTVTHAEWKNLADTRQTYRHADQVTLISGSSITVFNLCGNDFRLLVSIHYGTQIVFIRDFLTHAYYSKNQWKNEH